MLKCGAACFIMGYHIERKDGCVDVDSRMEAQERIRRRRYRRRRRKRRRMLFWIIAACLAVFLVGMMIWRGQKNASPSSAAETDPPVSSEPSPTGPSTGAPAPSPAWRPITTDGWKLTLVNFQNPVPEDHAIQTVTLTNGLRVDERCYDDLQAMMDACREEGLNPVICSAYRTHEEQEELFRNKVDRLMEQGYSETDATREAGKVVAVPGTSEHELGLAVDIADMNHQLLDESQEDTEVQKWLLEHCWEYGFILRYPTGKSDITGIIYEPWHYRYVGREDAEQIRALDVCLEEYLAEN